MTKENLTISKIKIDLKKIFLRKTTSFLLSGALIPIGNIIIVNILSLLFTPSAQFKLVFSLIYYTFFLIIMLYDLINIISGFIAIKHSNITIVSDWVVNKATKRYSTRLNTPKPYTLFFASNGKYGIPYGENYQWSDFHSSTDKIVFDSTSIDDEFYLISINRQKNIIAYNKRFFEYKSE